jgi:hypothetical protein
MHLVSHQGLEDCHGTLHILTGVMPGQEFANTAQVDADEYLQFRDEWVRTYGRDYDAATYAQPAKAPPAA